MNWVKSLVDQPIKVGFAKYFDCPLHLGSLVEGSSLLKHKHLQKLMLRIERLDCIV